MIEDGIGRCLRQAEHIRVYLRHKYSVTANQVMVTTVINTKYSSNITNEIDVNILDKSYELLSY